MGEYIYTEDDDLDLERELVEIEKHRDMMAKDIEGLSKRATDLRGELKRRQLDPLTATAIQLAKDLGHALGTNKALSKKLKNMVHRIEVRDAEIKSTLDRNIWKSRAEKAEATIERSKKRKSRR